MSDCVPLLLVTSDLITTIAEGLNAGAGYKTLLGAEKAMTFQIPYPEHTLVPTKTEALNKLGGYKWVIEWC